MLFVYHSLLQRRPSMIVDIHTHTFPDGLAARTVDKLQSM